MSVDKELGRRIVVGKDADARSTVISDSVSRARSVRANGRMSVEIWRQEKVPALRSDDGTREGEAVATLPQTGVSYRMFLIPGGTESTPFTELSESNSLFAGTLAYGKVYLVLEKEETSLEPGDSFIIPGSRHTWRNPYMEDALCVCAVFPFADD